MNNLAFFETHARSGMVGLVGGTAWIDRSIRKAQKAITPDGEKSLFSHAFIIGERRADDHIWIIESDLEFHRKQIKLGVQENRLNKYFDEKDYPNVALLDFGLNEKQVKMVLTSALQLVADRAQYSFREIMGVLLAFAGQQERDSKNSLAQDRSFFCSAMVQHCFQSIELVFDEAVDTKLLTPEDIYRTTLPHQKFERIRTVK